MLFPNALTHKDIEEIYQFYTINGGTWYSNKSDTIVYSVKEISLLSPTKIFRKIPFINANIDFSDLARENNFKIYIPFPVWRCEKIILSPEGFNSDNTYESTYGRAALWDWVNGNYNDGVHKPLEERIPYIYLFRAVDGNDDLLNLDYSIRTPMQQFINNDTGRGHYPIFKKYEDAIVYCSTQKTFFHYTAIYGDEMICKCLSCLTNILSILKCVSHQL